MWRRIDSAVSVHGIKIDDLLDYAEDMNELLMYIQDVLELGIPEINKAFINALLQYAVYPSLIGSLCCLTKKPDI